MRPLLTSITLLLAAAIHAATPPPAPSAPAGAYAVKSWKADWPGCSWEDGVSEGRVRVIERAADRRWRVDYAVGRIGPADGGAAWNFPLGARPEATLRYVVRFSADFDWGKGGKLPGLGGGPGKTTGGHKADGTNGFSVRPMWRADGKAEAYVYHAAQKRDYGDSFPFPADFRLARDQDVEVRVQVRMNQPDRADGLLELRLTCGERSAVVRRDDMLWRKIPQIQVETLLFETFHGGSDLSWAPARASFAEFGALRLE